MQEVHIWGIFSAIKCATKHPVLVFLPYPLETGSNFVIHTGLGYEV